MLVADVAGIAGRGYRSVYATTTPPRSVRRAPGRAQDVQRCCGLAMFRAIPLQSKPLADCRADYVSPAARGGFDGTAAGFKYGQFGCVSDRRQTV